jgi:hypothetical protein
MINRLSIDSVDGLLFFFLVGTEELVPDNQHPAKIFVLVLVLGAVMYAVVRRRIKDGVERAERTNRFGMNKALKSERDHLHR